MSDHEPREPSPRGDDALRGRDVRNWWQIAVSLGGALALAGMAYSTLQYRLGTLESRVSTVEQKGLEPAQEAMRRVTALEDGAKKGDDLQQKVDLRLGRIEDQLKTVVCLLDKAKCAARLQSGIDR